MDVVDLLLAGPRGRWACMAAAIGLSPGLDRLVGRLERVVEARAGAHDPPIGAVHLAPIEVAALAGALAAVDPAPLRVTTDPLDLLTVLEAVADMAMPWQPPFPRDRMTGVPAVRQALRPFAEALLAAPAARWWATDVQLQLQHEAVGGTADTALHPLEYAPAAAELAAFHDIAVLWERELGARPSGERGGGEWWSFPTAWSPPRMHRLIATTRALTGLPALRPAVQEDSDGPEQILVRAAVPTRDALRVFEVHEPAHWIELVDRYPIDVTFARDVGWSQSTGGTGPWFIPDYQAVARDWDAVHVSVLGYLTTAGAALPVERGSTVLAGWDPDVTYWLHDVVALGPPARYRRIGDADMHHWRPGPSRARHDAAR